MTAVKSAAAHAERRWERLQRRNPWLAHVIQANKRYGENRGNHYAAAITFFSFLALFPLILLAVSVLGFVLHSNPSLQQQLLDDVAKNVPGSFGDTLRSSINSAIDARGGVGVTGLVGMLLTGSGWIANLRAAIEGVWGVPPRKRNLVKARLADLGVLAGLGVGILVSLGLTAAGTALSSRVVRAAGLSGVTGMGTLLTVVGIALAVGGDMIILSWVLIGLPGADAPASVRFRGTLMAAVGFEVLKIVGTYTIKASSTNPTLGPFAGIIAVLIWIQLVSRFMLFCVAWMASAQVLAAEEASTAHVVLVKDSTPESQPASSPAFSPAQVAATLFGAGAAAGAWAAHRARRGARRRPSSPRS